MNAEERVDIRLADEITHKVIAQIEKEFDLRCCGEGGSMPYNVAGISISFEAKRRATLEEARELQIKCTEFLLKAVNEDEKIRSYLAEYPFSSSRGKVDISFVDVRGEHYRDGTVAFVSNARDKIFYSTHSPLRNGLDSFFEESYADALKIVQKSPLCNADLRTHQSKPYEQALDEFLASFIKEVHTKWGLLSNGAGGNMRDGIEEFGFTFLSHKRTLLEEARALEIAVTEHLIAKINADERLRPYLKTYPFKEDRAKIHLRFKKGRGGYYTDGSVYNVTPVDNRLVYDTQTPPNSKGSQCITPQVIAEETYEEARQILQKKSTQGNK